jgi:ribonuclease HIII
MCGAHFFVPFRASLWPSIPMAKAFASDDDAPKKISSYTVKLTDNQMEQVRRHCQERAWEKFDVAYARFAFKGNKVNVTAYESGKLVVAGKETEDFVTNFIEPEVLGEARLGYDEVLHPDWFEPHAGLDESGKGDFFGPVITACVIADKSAIESWIAAGVKDSKKIVDTQIMRLDAIIRHTPGVSVEVFSWRMEKYNDLMRKPGANLNRLLGWQHAQGLIKALERKPVPWGLLDQFSEKPLAQAELKKKGVDFDLRMRTKAEEDPVVAAASVCARAEFVRAMKGLSDEAGLTLQKGASLLVKKQAHEIIAKFGVAALPRFVKLHFRTAYEVVKEAGKLEEFPLPEPKARIAWE